MASRQIPQFLLKGGRSYVQKTTIMSLALLGGTSVFGAFIVPHEQVITYDRLQRKRGRDLKGLVAEKARIYRKSRNGAMADEMMMMIVACD